MFQSDNRHRLLILGCSAIKLDTPGLLPAIERYDGPPYRVLRSFLRTSVWPKRLSIAVLSARYGLIGGLTPIEYYDQRMDRRRAAELRGQVTDTLLGWSQDHQTVDVVLGKEYIQALAVDELHRNGVDVNIVNGGIGSKLGWLKELLEGMRQEVRFPSPARPNVSRPLYFLPDWDDVLDVGYDFRRDLFSSISKRERIEKHVVQLMQPHRICDGVLVSLAQNMGSKGFLKKFGPMDDRALAPRSVRDVFGVGHDQWIFGDCGAFSYVKNPEPTITTEQAVALYQLYGFDFGASVDHIPVPEIATCKGKLVLDTAEQKRRVKLTRDNAGAFIELHRKRKCTFIPVGVIQGITAEDYARQLPEYLDMGYCHVALGGLVPRSDKDVLDIVRAVHEAIPKDQPRPWIHLMGVFRPKIQAGLRELGVTSFDSATYFRKAWLRSGQNYLGTDGNWYAAIRVPLTSDPRTRVRLEKSGRSWQEIEELEALALRALHDYADGRVSLAAVLEAVTAYDQLLDRNEGAGTDFTEAYKRTLEARPWELCDCPICTSLGIDVVIFRGYNRNKRRGAHNTLMLYLLISR